MQKVNANSQEKQLCAELEDEMRLFETIVRAHEETCDFTAEKVAPMIERARANPVIARCPSGLVSIINFKLRVNNCAFSRSSTTKASNIA